MKILQLGDGAMGQLLRAELEKEHEVSVYRLSSDLPSEKFDLVIDFSHFSNLSGLADYLKAFPSPTVIATTGYDEQGVQLIHELSLKMPVLFSGNFSIGINLMQRLVKEMQVALSDFDIEIVEKHHHFKADAPSGTAKMLLESLQEKVPLKPVYGREGQAKRQPGEVGLHSLRAGTIAGEHEVIFAGEDEILSLKHEALSKMIFVKGAIKGLNWMIDKPIGLYDMQDVLFKK